MTDATTNDPTPDVDLPVIGGGMAGMTAAAKAAKSGLRVVVEKGPEVGGSAVLSAGIIAAPADAQEFMGTNPSGDPARVAAFVQHYDDLIDFIESTGVWISPRVDGSTTIGVKTTDVLGFDMRGRAIDMIGYIQWCTAAVEQSGGAVVRSATVERLLTTGGSVTGAVVTDRDGTSDMHARYTLLASGGFHNHDQLKLQHLGPNAPFALSRGNTHSRGTGLQLGTAVGGHRVGAHGQLLRAPDHLPDRPRVRRRRLHPARANLPGRLRHRHRSDRGPSLRRVRRLLVRRPHDHEAARRHALFIGDAQLRGAPATKGETETGKTDPLEEAKACGGNYAICETVEELDEAAARFGYQGAAEAVRYYNAKVLADPDSLTVPRVRNRRPLDQAPWFVLEMQVAVTTTFGGLVTDTGARVLDASGAPVPGLLAAGMDAGGVYQEGYSGGLGLSGVFGMRAVETVLATTVASS